MSNAIDHKTYFDLVRKSLFSGKLTKDQVNAQDGILAAWKKSPQFKDLRWLAYSLATTFHETGKTMMPIVENLNYSTASRIRAVWPSRFRSDASAQPYVKNPQALANNVYGGRMGNDGSDDGWQYRGRGYVQLTGKDNYKKATRELKAAGYKVDFVKNPDSINQPEYAAQILFSGMVEGWFTGRKLGDYFSASVNDSTGARAIINSDVKINGKKIAEHHDAFLLALNKATDKVSPIDQSLIKAQLMAAIQSHLDAKARERDYDGILSLVSYTTSRNPKFYIEGQSGVDWRDVTWVRGYELLDEVMNGTRNIPTSEEFISLLPVLRWPDEHVSNRV